MSLRVADGRSECPRSRTEVGGSEINSHGALTTGIEGVVFLPQASIVGNLSYSWASGPDFWTAGAEGRYYLTPNTKLAGDLVWSGGGRDWLIGASLEHRWSGTPFSGFVSVDYLTGPHDWAALVGARVFFDQPNATLQSHDFDVPFNTGTFLTY